MRRSRKLLFQFSFQLPVDQPFAFAHDENPGEGSNPRGAACLRDCAIQRVLRPQDEFAWVVDFAADGNSAPFRPLYRYHVVRLDHQGLSFEVLPYRRFQHFHAAVNVEARLLIESGADVPYVGTACPKTPWSQSDCEWLEARGAIVQYRASLEQDLAAFREFKPDLAIGTTPVVQAAKSARTPSLYFTNLISARPLMGSFGTAPSRTMAKPLSRSAGIASAGSPTFRRRPAFMGEFLAKY